MTIQKAGTLETNTLTPEEYITLTKNVGWGAACIDDVEIALKNSLIVFVKRIDGIAVGAVRIVGDGKLCCYIQDLMVLTSHRRQGVARELMDWVMSYIQTNAAQNCYIGLMATIGNETFYTSYGFIPLPSSDKGPGMIQFLGRKGKSNDI